MIKAELTDLVSLTDRPYTIQVIADPDILRSKLDSAGARVPILVVDLAACADEDSFFSAVIRSLCMPYQTLNWDGFYDAMTDLTWLKVENINIIFLNGASLYRSNPNLFQRLVSALDAIGAEWAKPISEGTSWDRAARPFHALFVSERKSDLPLQVLEL